jgi:hypothetical protein
MAGWMHPERYIGFMTCISGCDDPCKEPIKSPFASYVLYRLISPQMHLLKQIKRVVFKTLTYSSIFIFLKFPLQDIAFQP